MDPRKSGMRFKTTSWTLIGEARDNRQDLERLLAQYWSPVYAYLRRHGHAPADAEDLTQAFLVKVMLDRDMLGRADRSRGRFRSFLLTALSRFVIDAYRHEQGRHGQRRRLFVPEDPAALAAAEPVEGDDPACAFDRQWATAVLELALERVRTACAEDGLHRHWRAFDERVLRPAQRGCEPTPYDELLESLGARDRQELYSMLQTVKERLQRALRDVVGDTVADPAEVQQELSDLREFLALGG